jgi:L-histidine Nalpha-methyltransferase
LFETKILKAGPASFHQDEQFASAVHKGLSLANKCLPSWLIFDSEGSKIFKKITELADYLPAACEFEIINHSKNKVSDLISDKTFNLIELGSGDGCKTRILIEHFLNKHHVCHYFPIDISSGAVTNLVQSLEADQKGTSLNVTGLIGDYFDGLNFINQEGSKQNLVLFLGVTLNNMDPEAARSFLNNLHKNLGPKDYLMIGFDLMKNPKLLYSAYNNRLFEEFNLYLLESINQKLGADFNKDNFVQQGQYNPLTHAVESNLFSTCTQVVNIKALNTAYHFDAWEPMQTEQSLKYTLEEIENLAVENGFEIVEHLFDSRKYFVDSIWRVAQ